VFKLGGRGASPLKEKGGRATRSGKIKEELLERHARKVEGEVSASAAT